MNEQSADTVELFIIESLLKGKNIVIPDFGHLEIKSFGERRTVFFKSKSAGNNDSFLRIMSAENEKEKKNTDALYSIISIPLKEEKTVNLPKIGIFRPLKKESGEIHISFILSAYLRKLLVEEGNKVENKQENKEEKKADDTNVSKGKTQEIQKEEIITNINQAADTDGKSAVKETLKSSDTTFKHKTSSPSGQRSAKVGDQIIPPDDIRKKSRSRNLSGTILFLVAVITLIVVVVTTINSRNNKKADEHVEITLPSESISLPSLAESHYGNPVFWIYIYEANIDKLSSPVNVPKNLSLVIPDLKTEYDVDVTDSMEIQRASILADIVLKEKIKKK